MGCLAHATERQDQPWWLPWVGGSALWQPFPQACASVTPQLGLFSEVWPFSFALGHGVVTF